MNPRLWFYDNNIRIFPVQGKVPTCRSWDDFTCTRFEAASLGNYGVALGLFGVADSDSPESEAWNAANLPATPFIITTGRGRHRYYRLVGDAPHFFHRAGLTIEFRHRGQYVVGPGSTHASGAVYTADAWSWKINDIPLFPVDEFIWDDRPLEQRGSTESGQPLILPPVILAGERHDLMFKLMRSLQARGITDIETLLKVLRVENKQKCAPPIDDRELESYIRRVAKYKDRPGFDRLETLTLSNILDTGLSLDGVVEVIKSTDPSFDLTGGGEWVAPDEPKQPKQPFSAATERYPASKLDTKLDTIQLLEAEKLDTIQLGIQLQKVKHQNHCAACQHDWITQHTKTPKRCPKCRSMKWRSDDAPPDEPLLLDAPIPSSAVVIKNKEAIPPGAFIHEGTVYYKSLNFIIGDIVDGVYRPVVHTEADIAYLEGRGELPIDTGVSHSGNSGTRGSGNGGAR